ncbi:protein PAL OF QUIRKY [Lotus japonicus]|uniref:protein PAL OF QUIRKY n=1 Tax=Lotus japonicus TaxID=34305 RepID=UPI002582A8B0|nr:protein PAL OF QUIRKY [Lotus japonicus]
MGPTHDDSGAKLRLMCSYGGHILPRPRTATLCYVGGDTRIVSVDRRAVTTLSSLVSHLSSALSLDFPFAVKYQLPHLDLRSLISLSSDSDFRALLDRHHRLSSPRIRLFLFPLIRHPKTDSWFFDGGNFLHPEVHRFVSSAPPPRESGVVLETSSSFESSSSSASFTSLPPSDNCVSSIMSHQQNISHQDPVVHISEARLNAESIEVESESPYIISAGVIANNTKIGIGYSAFPQPNQVERSHLQPVQAAAQVLPLHPSGVLPVPSYQLIYQQPHPLQHPTYHINQPSPVYLVPVGNMPLNASNQVSLNLNAPSMNFHVDQDSEVGARCHFAHGSFASQNYLTDNATISFVYVPYNGSKQPEMDIYPMHQQSQTVSITEFPKDGNELDDELAHDQIYKSQPPPPTMPSKHQTMTKATTNLVSEALAQLQGDDLKQQTETTS